MDTRWVWWGETQVLKPGELTDEVLAGVQPLRMEALHGNPPRREQSRLSLGVTSEPLGGTKQEIEVGIASGRAMSSVTCSLVFTAPSPDRRVRNRGILDRMDVRVVGGGVLRDPEQLVHVPLQAGHLVFRGADGDLESESFHASTARPAIAVNSTVPPRA